MAAISPTPQSPDTDVLAVRQATEALCEPLETEDYVAQSAPEISPTKWHLAHTTWFFETFVLEPNQAEYRVFDPNYRYLFNSYYNSVGEQYPRPSRGVITRPTVAEVFAYRRWVDEALAEALPQLSPEAAAVAELGRHHEQQHQELMLMDLKHVFSCNPLYPAYGGNATPETEARVPPLDWWPVKEGVHAIGDDGAGFAFDNERPRHRVYLHNAELADRLITNGEYLAFIEDGGYQRPELWLSDGWNWLQEQGVNAPLYWVATETGWQEYTLAGLKPLDPARPVCHVSFYEAEAFASWMGARLPTEAEWEVLAAERARPGNFVESGRLHPAPDPGHGQLLGDCWEWTYSAYTPYPGYRPPEGALGEYNGKFMSGQYVLRGGSCVTPAAHTRISYRNFFYPDMRWPFTGIRLARDA